LALTEKQRTAVRTFIVTSTFSQLKLTAEPQQLQLLWAGQPLTSSFQNDGIERVIAKRLRLGEWEPWTSARTGDWRGSLIMMMVVDDGDGYLVLLDSFQEGLEGRHQSS